MVSKSIGGASEAQGADLSTTMMRWYGRGNAMTSVSSDDVEVAWECTV